MTNSWLLTSGVIIFLKYESGILCFFSGVLYTPSLQKAMELLFLFNYSVNNRLVLIISGIQILKETSHLQVTKLVHLQNVVTVHWKIFTVTRKQSGNNFSTQKKQNPEQISQQKSLSLTEL